MADPTADEFAVRRTLAAFCQHLDDGDFAAVADLFTPDGAFDYEGRGATGRAELRQWFAEANPPDRLAKHLTLNPLVELHGDRASASSDFLYLRVEDGVVTPAITGRYEDELRRAGGRWLIRSRVVRPLRTA